MAGRAELPSLELVASFSRLPGCWAGGSSRRAELGKIYCFTMELFGGLLVVRFIEGVHLCLRLDFLVVGEVVSSGELTALELNRRESTSSRASPCPKSKSLFSPL